ncbi:MAG: hypothetical protein ACYCT9_07920 [Leptospirillum sp.]
MTEEPLFAANEKGNPILIRFRKEGEDATRFLKDGSLRGSELARKPQHPDTIERDPHAQEPRFRDNQKGYAYAMVRSSFFFLTAMSPIRPPRFRTEARSTVQVLTKGTMWPISTRG